MSLAKFLLRELECHYQIIKKFNGKQIIVCTKENKNNAFNIAYQLIESNEEITIKKIKKWEK